MKTFVLLTVFALAASQIAVSSVHNDCGSSCFSNTNCCGTDSSCSGSTVDSRCCPNNSSFCGCISSRGFCSGSIYGESTRPQGTDSFGTCFDSAQGSCTYNPSSNLWIVCPTSYTSCPSNSYYTCCSSGQTCFTNTGASFATCAAPTGGPNVITPAAGSTLYYNQAYTFNYIPAVAGDVNYNIITGGNNQAYGQGTLNSDGSVSISYTLRSFSPSNGQIQLTFVEGNVSTTVTVNAAVKPSTSSAAAPVAATQSSQQSIDTGDCAPNGCAGGALCCGGQCYSTGQYKCHQKADASYQLCPQDMDICGNACYSPSAYQCDNAVLSLL